MLKTATKDEDEKIDYLHCHYPFETLNNGCCVLRRATVAFSLGGTRQFNHYGQFR